MRPNLDLLAAGLGIVGLVAALGCIPPPPVRWPAQASGPAAHQGRWTRQADKGAWRVGVQFTNYNGDRLNTTFPVTRGDVDQAVTEFGYLPKESQAVFTTCAGCSQEEYDRRLLEFYRGRGLAAKPVGNVWQLSVDMPALVRRNAPRVGPVARAIEALARDRGYDGLATIGAALSLAQTGLAYGVPPDPDDGRQAFGLYVPPQVLVAGSGDCDSKTGLVASVLKNFSGAKLVGVDLPNHYLMGVARIPARGDAYVEHEGETYVLLEPAGPAWLPPGRVSEHTLALLGTRRDVRIESLR